ncbi:MAG: M23 family metallopeptidase [Solirubrobacteraceae bacterium]|nr:M23 family metallopeptidase [Solirubrobacteraceae bacterium]
MRPFLIAAVYVAALAIAPAVAAATGGTPAPLRSGGAAFGSPLPVPDRQPVARQLAPVPREISNGDAAPTIRLHVRQRGVASVRGRIVVLRLPGNRPVGRVDLGRVRTGRRVTVALPDELALTTGRYLVRLHATDPRGHVLRRSAAYPGRARVVVRRRPPAPRPAPSPLLPAPALSAAGPGVFPVAGPFDFGGAGARFGAGRAGHVHQGQDIIAAAGTPVVAPYAGTVAQTAFQSSGAGEYVVLDAIDGRAYFFAHCQRGSTVVVQGAPVAAGQPLCRVGATGMTSGAPHLHLEIWAGGWRVPGGVPIDPLPELRAWSGR